MGLDMYLEKKVNDEWVEIGYWRKANHIRAWFERHLPDFADNSRTPITQETLKELLVDCQKVLLDHDKAKLLLPRQSGFFFGSLDYDEYYYEDIEDTIKMIQDILSSDLSDTELAYSEWY